MNTLKTIQVLSKIGKVISKIIFVFCVIGFCLCVVGIVSQALGAPTFKIGGTTFKSILQNEAGLSEGTLYAAMAVGAIFCAGEAVLARFAVHYFDRELADGTPFTLGGAKELLRLGILAICIPIGTQIIAAIVRSILENVMTGVEAMELESSGSASIGIMLIVTALICRYGAELTEGKQM